MTIDKAIEFYNDLMCYTPEAKDARDTAIETMRKYKLVQAAHFRRLNIGMASMLTDLKNELTDISWNIDMYDSDLDFECCYLSDIHEIIQEKINKLREELDGNDD